MTDRQRYGEMLPFAKFLSEEERKMVQSSMRFRSYGARGVLYENSGECLGYIRILTGRVRTILISPEGRRSDERRVGM